MLSNKVDVRAPTRVFMLSEITGGSVSSEAPLAPSTPPHSSSPLSQKKAWPGPSAPGTGNLGQQGLSPATQMCPPPLS